MSRLPWLKGFIALLSSLSDSEWETAFELKAQHLPKSLFRYRAPTKENVTNIRDDNIWLPAASQFNDPFDSSLTVAFEPMMRGALAKALNESPPDGFPKESLERIRHGEDPVTVMDDLFVQSLSKNSPIEQAKAIAARVYERFLERESSRATQSFSSLLQSSMKIACFSETALSLQLWSLYTECHRGFSVEYDLTQLPADDLRLRMLFPVNYTEQRFQLAPHLERAEQDNMPVGPNVAILAAIHKSPDWEREREWRLIDPLRDKQLGKMQPMPVPKSLFLGARMKAEVRDELLGICNTKGIKAFDVQLAHNRFELTAVPVQTKPEKRSP